MTAPFPGDEPFEKVLAWRAVPHMREMGAYTKSLFSVAEFPVSSGKIPVLILREFAGNALIFLVVGRSTSPKALPSVKISLYFPGDQGSRQGDRFADDCLHRQVRLMC